MAGNSVVETQRVLTFGGQVLITAPLRKLPFYNHEKIFIRWSVFCLLSFSFFFVSESIPVRLLEFQ